MASDKTTLLNLPYIAAAQAQKHVTHNDALAMLDALVQLSVLSDTVSAPPATPSEGDRYIAPAGGTGAFAGIAGRIVSYQSGAWTNFVPQRGWVAYIVDRAELRYFDGAVWQAITSAITTLPKLGINASADTVNRLSLSAQATLLSNEGAGHQLKINKARATDTGSLLYQTGFSGRAEMGLTGSDDFQIKVSSNGSSWFNALQMSAGSGIATFAYAPTVPGLNGGPLAGFRNRILNGAFSVNQRGYASGGALAANAYGFDRWRAGSGGCTMTFTAGIPDTLVTITAGSLVQIVEAANVEGGTYTLSWSGTAQGRFYQGSAPAYVASPVTISGLASGTQIAIEFSGGTLGTVQLEPGSMRTPYERRLAGIDLALCQRYLFTGSTTLFRANSSGAFAGGMTIYSFPVTMRAAPSIAVSSVTGSFTIAAPVNLSTTDHAQFWFASGSGVGDFQSFNFSALAEL